MIRLARASCPKSDECRVLEELTDKRVYGRRPHELCEHYGKHMYNAGCWATTCPYYPELEAKCEVVE